MYTSGDIGICSLRVLFDNGLYVFDNESAIGKTWLGEVAKAINSTSKDIGYITYNQSDMTNSYTELMRSFVGRPVIVIDRYDLYRTDDIDIFVRSMAADSVVLVDTKDDEVFDDAKIAYIKREESMTTIGGISDVYV